MEIGRLKKRFREEFLSFKNNVTEYSELFGDIYNVVLSPYFLIAVILGFSTVLFLRENHRWTEIALMVLPGLLGFSIGGYAILISFGDEGFRKFLASTFVSSETSLFQVVNGVFLHFIIIQVATATLASLVHAISPDNFFVNFIGCTLFYYALLFCAAAAFEIKTVGKWYQIYVSTSIGSQSAGDQCSKAVTKFRNEE